MRASRRHSTDSFSSGYAFPLLAPTWIPTIPLRSRTGPGSSRGLLQAGQSLHTLPSEWRLLLSWFPREGMGARCVCQAPQPVDGKPILAPAPDRAAEIAPDSEKEKGWLASTAASNPLLFSREANRTNIRGSLAIEAFSARMISHSLPASTSENLSLASSARCARGNLSARLLSRGSISTRFPSLESGRTTSIEEGSPGRGPEGAARSRESRRETSLRTGLLLARGASGVICNHPRLRGAWTCRRR
ncbi:hypothetical protein GX411_07030 [Candidatus Fermentibacteria bacterium]|nr:hypothetical protein [Candidatus Fermentibacteria bacterium]